MSPAIVSKLVDEPRFVVGVGEFNAGNFFEAHEIWEELWNDLVGEPKQLCQGLIQIAAGYHKLAIGNPVGARKLFERAARTLADFAKEIPAVLDLVVRANRSIEQQRPDVASEEAPRLDLLSAGIGE